MGDVDRRETQILDLILMDEPFQRHGIPYNLIGWVGTGFLDCLLHVVVPFGIVTPAPVLHEMVAEAASMNDDLVVFQVLE